MVCTVINPCIKEEEEEYEFVKMLSFLGMGWCLQ